MAVLQLLTRDEARARADLLTVDSTVVDLDVTTGPDTFRSTSTVSFACASPGASTFLELLAERVHSVELNGRALDPAEVVDGRRVALSGLQADNEVTVVADCAYSRTGEGLHRFTDPADGEVYLYAAVAPYLAHRVYACFDQPDLKTTFTLSVTAPPGWTCLSNSPSDVPSADGTRWSFAPTPRLSTYITALVAGPYHGVREQHEGLDLGWYCRRSLAPHIDTDELFTLTRQSFAAYRERFRTPYAFGPAYTQAFVPEFNWGAMESAACVTFGEHHVFRSAVTAIARRDRAETIAHELAHMWFGDLVTLRWWEDMWLNESFAEYLGVDVVASSTRFTDAWTGFATTRKAWGYRADQRPSTHPVAPEEVTDTEAALLNFDGISYAKGASLLRQLAAWVGGAAFARGLDDHIARNAYGNATLADLLDAMSAASGRDVHAWARAWLQTAGTTTLRAEVRVGADGTYEAVALRQLPPTVVPARAQAADAPVLLPHKVALGLYDRADGRLRRRRRVEVDVDGALTDVGELAGVAAADLLLVNDGDLTFAKVRLDERSLATVLADVNAVEDPLARAVCWTATADMVRDGELPASRWLSLATTAVAVEPDLSVLHGVLADVGPTLGYLAPHRRSAASAALAEAALARAAAAEPGSDLALRAVQLFAVRFEGAGQVATARALLAGTPAPGGVAVDTDLRWSLLSRLAALGEADEDEVAAELARDNTSAGAKQAARTRASRPTAAAKERGWADVVDSDRLSNDLASWTAGGLWQPGQEDLARPYLARFFAALPGLWAGRGTDTASSLTPLLYPATLVEPATLTATQEFLARPGLPEGLRRLVRDSAADVERALRARAVDAAEPDA